MIRMGATPTKTRVLDYVRVAVQPYFHSMTHASMRVCALGAQIERNKEWTKTRADVRLAVRYE
jgi:hypothetical protein